MSWRLGVLGLTAVVAAPVAPVHQQLPPAEGLTSTPAPPPAPRQASAADPIVPQDGGEGTTKMGIIAPLVIAGAIAIAVLYFLYWHRAEGRRHRAQTISPSAEELAAPLTENAAPEPRRRRGLNLDGGLGRSESGRSIRTLPAYTKEAGDEERVLLRRDPSLSSRGHEHDHARRRSDLSGLSVVTEGTDPDLDDEVAPLHWGGAPSYDLGYGYGFGDAYDPPDDPPPPGAHVRLPRAASDGSATPTRSISMVTAHTAPHSTASGRATPTRSVSMVTAHTTLPAASPSLRASSATTSPMATARTSLASVPPLSLSIPLSPSTPPPASATTVTGARSPSMVTARSAMSTPTRRSPAHSTPPPARSASYAASHRSVSSGHEPVRAASAPPLPPGRAGVQRASEALREVVGEGVAEEPDEVLRDEPGDVGELQQVGEPQRSASTASHSSAAVGVGSTTTPASVQMTPESGSEPPTPTATPTTGTTTGPTTGGGAWTRLRMLSPF